MAGRRSQITGIGFTYEPLEKLASSTLKRHPKTELNKTDLLKLLSVLEAELQAREIVIAVLKAEQVKQLLYPKKKINFASDPWSALQRDVFGAFDPNFDENSVKALYSIQLHQLEVLIVQQRKVQGKLRQQLKDVNDHYSKMIAELDDERRKHAQDTAQGDDVTYMLEKEREMLRQEVDFERQHNKKLDKESKRLVDTLDEERCRQKQIVLLLLAERKRLILKLLEERESSLELQEILHDEKSRISEMVEGLEEESKKSLQMEAELERSIADFVCEREEYKMQIATLELRNHELLTETECLQDQVETLKKQLDERNAVAAATPSPIHIGEGVRSTIVTVVSTAPTIRAVPTVAPTANPPRSVAKPVAPKVTPAPATPAKPPGLVPHLPAKITTPGPITSPKAVISLTPVTTTPTKDAKSTNSSRAVSPSSAEKQETPVHREESATPEATPNSSHSNRIAVKSIVGKLSPQTATNPTPPQPGIRKILPVDRGTPPPVPPNKPTLQSAGGLLRKELGPKPPVPPRGDISDGDGKSPKVLPPRVAKTETAAPKAEEELQVSCNNPVDCITAATIVDESLEIFGQELDDFQELFVSMASDACSGDDGGGGA